MFCETNLYVFFILGHDIRATEERKMFKVRLMQVKNRTEGLEQS